MALAEQTRKGCHIWRDTLHVFLVKTITSRGTTRTTAMKSKSLYLVYDGLQTNKNLNKLLTQQAISVRLNSSASL